MVFPIRLYNSESGVNKIRNLMRDKIVIKARSEVRLGYANVRFQESSNNEQFILENQLVKANVRGSVSEIKLNETYNSPMTFLNGLMNHMNYMMTTVGTEWSVTYDGTNPITLNLGDYEDIHPDLSTLNGKVKGDWASLNNGEALASGDDSAYYRSKYHLSRGGWKITFEYHLTGSSFRVTTIDTADDDDVILRTGLLISEGDSYILEVRGIQKETLLDDVLTVVPADGDVIQLSYSQGILSLEVFSAQGDDKGELTVSVLDEIPDVSEREYNMVLQNVGDGLPDEEGGVTIMNISEVKDSALNSNNATLTLGRDLATYLGYHETEMTQSVRTGEIMKFTANSPLRGDMESTGIMILLDGLGNIKGYDGQTGRRTNIVGIIPSEASLVGTLDSEDRPPTNDYQPLGNMTDITVSVLEVSFRTNLDLPALKLRKGASIVLWVKEPGEERRDQNPITQVG
jgi:hypothetical protein